MFKHTDHWKFFKSIIEGRHLILKRRIATYSKPIIGDMRSEREEARILGKWSDEISKHTSEVRETADPSDATVMAVRYKANATAAKGHWGKTRYEPAGGGGEKTNYPTKLVQEVGDNKLPYVGCIMTKWIAGMAHRGRNFYQNGRTWPSDE
jgi:hypothetical protein